MKLDELTDIIAFELKNPDDAVLKEIIKNLIITSRAILIRQEFNKTRVFPESAVLTIRCLPIIEVNSTECCNIDLGCKIIRTEDKLPRLIEVKDTVSFTYVGGVVQFGADEFGYLKPEEVGYIKYRKYSRTRGFYTYLNDYLYIFNKPALEALTVRGPFANLIELANLRSCDNTPCFNIESTIPIEDHWEDAITKMIMMKLQKPIDSEIAVNKEEITTT